MQYAIKVNKLDYEFKVGIAIKSVRTTQWKCTIQYELQYAVFTFFSL